MKKPLQTPKEQFLISSKGKLIGWGKADVKNLLSRANQAKDKGLKSKESMPLFEFECLLTLQWLELFVTEGITKETVEKLNRIISHVRYHHVLIHSPGELPFWRRIANADQMTEPEVGVAYGVAQLLSIGALEGLKRCHLDSCLNFFIGRPNAKWCSKTCGSHFRVTQKRKRDNVNEIAIL